MPIACLITDGMGRPACPGETPKCFDTFWLANRDEIASFTLTGNLITAFTFDAGKGFYQVTGKKGSIRAYEERADGSAVSYTQAVDFRLEDLSPEARDFVQQLNGPSLLAVVHTKGGKFIVIGYNDGGELQVNTMDTETEELGEFCTIRETECDEKTRRYLITDEDTTVAALVAKTVGS